MPKLKRILKTCLYPSHLRRTGSIAFIVGSWLTLLNHGDVIWAGQPSSWIWVKVVLNYLTPFAVANFGLMAREPKKKWREEHQERLEPVVTSRPRPHE